MASGRSEMELLQSIEEDAFSVLAALGAPPPRRIHQGSLKSMIAQLQNLKNVVDDVLNTRLDFYVEVSNLKKNCNDLLFIIYYYNQGIEVL